MDDEEKVVEEVWEGYASVFEPNLAEIPMEKVSPKVYWAPLFDDDEQ